jgi:hypothetical protein
MRESSCSKRACEGVATEAAVAPESAMLLTSGRLRLCGSRCRGRSHWVFHNTVSAVLYVVRLAALATHCRANSGVGAVLCVVRTWAGRGRRMLSGLSLSSDFLHKASGEARRSVNLWCVGRKDVVSQRETVR